MRATILVGIDASTPSRSAIAWSVSRAATLGAAVELIHVVDSDVTDSLGPVARARATQFLETERHYALQLGGDVPIATTLAEGCPPDVLAERSSAYSLLVVGTHKTGFIYGRAFGSRFLALAWRAGCDMAFIPDQGGYDRHGIVAGVEKSPTGDAIIRCAAAEAVRASEELLLVASGGSGMDAPGGGKEMTQRAEMVADALALARAAEPQVRVRSTSADQPSPEALIEASTSASLLVIGRRRSAHAISGLRVGNHDVLINMSSPVLVVLDDSEERA
ncbi:universal stress protein [Salinibacterium sp.]|uniref:universal stress protein n=2 Tax=Salinibacterium sp. TaxID=1915057 RepID=UPI00286B3379|nr:universal stress protein [Salinibacterium sp.]